MDEEEKAAIANRSAELIAIANGKIPPPKVTAISPPPKKTAVPRVIGAPETPEEIARRTAEFMAMDRMRPRARLERALGIAMLIGIFVFLHWVFAPSKERSNETPRAYDAESTRNYEEKARRNSEDLEIESANLRCIAAATSRYHLTCPTGQALGRLDDGTVKQTLMCFFGQNTVFVDCKYIGGTAYVQTKEIVN